MTLFWRIWQAIILVDLSVLALFVWLALLQFAGIKADLVGERLLVLAEQTAAPFKAAGRIGLPLANVRNANALLERARQTDDTIQAIHVFDETGRILHSTDSAHPESISPGALKARRVSAGESWYRETSEGFLSSIDIPVLGRKAPSGIVIVYPATGSNIQVRAMGAELSLAAVAVLFVSSVLSTLLLGLVLRQQVRHFDDTEHTISDFERSSWRTAAGESVKTVANGYEPATFGQLLQAAEERYLSVCKSIENVGEKP